MLKPGPPFKSLPTDAAQLTIGARTLSGQTRAFRRFRIPQWHRALIHRLDSRSGCQGFQPFDVIRIQTEASFVCLVALPAGSGRLSASAQLRGRGELSAAVQPQCRHHGNVRMTQEPSTAGCSVPAAGCKGRWRRRHVSARCSRDCQPCWRSSAWQCWPSPRWHTSGAQLACRILLFVFPAAGSHDVQVLLVVLRRHRERPQRPTIIWSMDITKQMFSSSAGHVCGASRRDITFRRLMTRFAQTLRWKARGDVVGTRVCRAHHCGRSLDAGRPRDVHVRLVFCCIHLRHDAWRRPGGADPQAAREGGTGTFGSCRGGSSWDPEEAQLGGILHCILR